MLFPESWPFFAVLSTLYLQHGYATEGAVNVSGPDEIVNAD